MAAAFYEDPVLGWLLPHARSRSARLRRFFDLELRAVGLARGLVWATEDLTGAAITTPPGKWRLPWAVQLRHGPTFARVFGARLPHAAVLLQLMENRHPREPHHYIAYVGVEPSRQGRGLGAALLEPTLARCDEAGLPAYLEATSPRNVALYERLGFALTGRLTVGSSPPLVLMRRPPSS
jgi:GNAT superfamily N-acetyltransferase